MNELKKKTYDSKFGYYLGIITKLAIIFFITWIINCIFIKLIAVCFGWGFSLLVATGIWLIIVFLNLIIRSFEY